MSGKITDFGFNFGAASVTRVWEDDPTGKVCIWITTPKDKLEIRVTKGGKIRVFRQDVELKEVKA